MDRSPNEQIKRKKKMTDRKIEKHSERGHGSQGGHGRQEHHSHHSGDHHGEHGKLHPDGHGHYYDDEGRYYDEDGHRLKRVKTTKRVKSTRKHKSRKRKSGKGNRNMILAIIILLLIVIFAGIFIYGSQLDRQRNAELANLETPAVETEIYGDETLGIDPTADERLQGYRNILLLGTDVPDENGQRADGNIIVSINKETKDVKIFSMSRDTFMEVEEGSYEKLTHAYMHGGRDQTLWAINHTLDLNIRDVVVFELEDVAAVVDRVGGVEVELSDRELEFLNQMVGSNKVPGAGIQTLNGDQAVMYSRMRKDVETLSDFRRNERLKIVMTGALKKAQALEGEALITFAEETMDDIETSMRPDEIIGMAQEAGSYNIVSSDETYPFNFRGWSSEETGRVFVPITLESNIEKLYENYFGIYDYEPSETVQALNDAFIDMTGYGKKDE